MKSRLRRDDQSSRADRSGNDRATAMAKSRDDRYLSAQALADDLERFLAGKPTLARRPSLADRAAKWARRHRSLVTVGACSWWC